jgi:membrane dipeptidase
VIASHTSARALHDCDRAKNDEELRAIADTGGVIGIYAVPFFLTAPDAPEASIDLMLDQICYVSDLVGWQHVGIGTDWPAADAFARWPAAAKAAVEAGLGELGFRPEHGIDITRGLVARGLDDEQIAGILGENVLRVFGAVFG